MLAEQSSDFLVQLADLLLKDLQLVQRHLQEPTIHGLEVGARAECITQLFWRSAQAFIRQSGDSCWVDFAFGERLQHPPGTGA